MAREALKKESNDRSELLRFVLLKVLSADVRFSPGLHGAKAAL